MEVDDTTLIGRVLQRRSAWLSISAVLTALLILEIPEQRQKVRMFLVEEPQPVEREPRLPGNKKPKNLSSNPGLLSEISGSGE